VRHHVVVSGDTLAKIAQRYGVSMYAIAAANNIANLNLIYRGQTLIIP
jgi:LysM repeat protein